MDRKKTQINATLSRTFLATHKASLFWHRSLTVFIFICLLFTAPGQNFGKTTPAKPNLDQLDRYIEQARNDWQIPGMAVAIVKNGKIVLAKGYGLKEINKDGQVDENTLFAIASNSKAFTAATLALLVDEGKIKWEDKVRTYLPYFKLYNSYISDEITIRDLLCHRSGLGTFSGDLIWYETPYSTAEVIKRARFLKPDFGFRSGFGYSNIMFMVASEVVVAVSGKTWPEFLKERIFTPLGMTSTHCGTTQLKNYDNVASPHFIPPNEGATAITIPYTHSDAAAGAAAINSSVSDMAQWLIMLLNQGKKAYTTILSVKSIHEMWESQNPIRLSEAFKKYSPTTHFRSYGLGWNLHDYNGHKIVSHSGALDGMISGVTLVPEIKLGIVVLTNSMNGLPQALINKTIDTFLHLPPTDWSKMSLERTKKLAEKAKLADAELAKKAKEQKPLPPFPTALEDYIGTYVDEMYGEVAVVMENGGLVLNNLTAPIFMADLTPRHYDTLTLTLRNKFSFIPKGTGTAQFIRDKDGKVKGMEIDIPNDDFIFAELHFKKKEESVK